MKVLIVEDEQPASQRLARLLKNIDRDVEVVAILTSVEQSVNWLLGSQHPDLIFMDIQLEDGICFEIFEKLKIKVPVIFTTAYDEYALKAFKVNSIDYLLKPLQEDEVRNAVGKFLEVYGHHEYFSRIESLITGLQPRNKERFLIKVGEHYKSVLTDEVCCFYILERCNFIHTRKGKDYPIDLSLDKLETMIDKSKFFRVNRNFIINLNCIRDVIIWSSNRLKIHLEGWEKEEILVSRERVSDFKEWMDR